MERRCHTHLTRFLRLISRDVMFFSAQKTALLLYMKIQDKYATKCKNIILKCGPRSFLSKNREYFCHFVWRICFAILGKVLSLALPQSIKGETVTSVSTIQDQHDLHRQECDEEVILRLKIGHPPDWMLQNADADVQIKHIRKNKQLNGSRIPRTSRCE